MAKNKFKQTKQKISKMFEQSQTNQSIVSEDLKKIRIDFSQVSHNKKITRIRISDKERFPLRIGSETQYADFVFHVEFTNLSDDFILYSKVHHYFTTENTDLSMADFWSTNSENMNYWWQRVGETGAILHGRVAHTTPRNDFQNGQFVQTHILHTVELVFYNPRLYHEIQTD